MVITADDGGFPLVVAAEGKDAEGKDAAAYAFFRTGDGRLRRSAAVFARCSVLESAIWA
ncbi:hypothetical protein [Arthrobacter sp. H14-L1]|uniref:hypothetical protein n=1 Tax=Arthrobacter sp. H14-L1 TaxID=2996697 RepID=UPI00226EDA12|nr:hypothetical protein [Arthrobacter sp. H14-L1]MCY0906409.1 hypothetical protein [Arthrobacter sp. H14-L1]